MEIPRLNISQLITFYLVAREQSFTTAAEKLFLTESAVSQQIKSLETTTGLKLLNARKKKITLTESGQVLFNYAEEIYNTALKAQAYINQIKRSELRVGFSTTFSTIIASVATKFKDLYPNLKLTLRNSSSRDILNQMIDMQFDLAIVIKSDYHTEKFKIVKIASDEKFVLVTKMNISIPQGKLFTLANLTNYTFLLPREGSTSRELIMKRFRADRVEPKNTMLLQMDYIQAGKMLAEMDNSIAIVPEFIARQDISQGKLRIFPLLNEIYFDVDAIFPLGIPIYKPAEAFVQLVKRIFEKIHQETKTNYLNLEIDTNKFRQ